MKKKIIVITILILVIAAVVTSLIFILKEEDPANTPKGDEPKDVMGVWWWDDELDAEKYLSFAKDNKINEIYYCSGNLDENTSKFIELANKLDISVYWLQGEYQWLNDSSGLINKIDRYCQYQQDYPNFRFSGIHLDIEPHQNPYFETKREELILKLIELADFLDKTYTNISFDYDIPFWLNDNITYNNLNCPAYQHLIDIADRIFVMSYRDTADGIINVASEELSYAESVDKKLFLSVECLSYEGDKVSFMEEGKSVMNEELSIIKDRLGNKVGIAIHNIKTWYDMKE